MNTRPVRLGIIGSSGGSALAAAAECLVEAGKHVDWVVVTDRQCGLEDWARGRGLSSSRIDYKDAETFSKSAFETFRAADCTNILLFYTRRVASPLIDRLRVWNIHPSLLPAFPGLHAVRDAAAAGVRLFGATLHHVDSGLDSGKIVAQVGAPFPASLKLDDVEHLSYLQKVWLTLIWFEQLHHSHCHVDSRNSYLPGVAISNPSLLDNGLKLAYLNFLARSERLLSQ